MIYGIVTTLMLNSLAQLHQREYPVGILCHCMLVGLTLWLHVYGITPMDVRTKVLVSCTLVLKLIGILFGEMKFSELEFAEMKRSQWHRQGKSGGPGPLILRTSHKHTPQTSFRSLQCYPKKRGKKEKRERETERKGQKGKQKAREG